MCPLCIPSMSVVCVPMYRIPPRFWHVSGTGTWPQRRCLCFIVWNCEELVNRPFKLAMLMISLERKLLLRVKTVNRSRTYKGQWDPRACFSWACSMLRPNRRAWWLCFEKSWLSDWKTDSIALNRENYLQNILMNGRGRNTYFNTLGHQVIIILNWK